jgi:hypothetical protein
MMAEHKQVRAFSPPDMKRRRSRAIAMALALVVFIVIVFITTIYKMKGGG